MDVLGEDMILEILVRLPLKCALRCMILNKDMFHLISQQKKALIASTYPNIEGSILCCSHCFRITTFGRITPGNCEMSTRTMPMPIPERYDDKDPILLDSCNGVLLLYFRKQLRTYVFNPITGGIMLVSPFVIRKLNVDNIALAVDLDARTIFQFKLVVAEKIYHSEEESMLSITVLVPSGGRSWLIKSTVGLNCTGDPFGSITSVYVHGCVYWIDELNHRILMFDVEKEKTTNIYWPECSTKHGAYFCGSSYGSLLSVCYSQNEFEIHSYDPRVKDEWQLQHKITNNTLSRTVVMFCNGRHLLIKDCPDIRDGELLMYNILSDKWEKISPEFYGYKIDYPSDSFSFMPTLAKVSDKYLHDPGFEFMKVYLRGLQRLVMQKSRDVEEMQQGDA